MGTLYLSHRFELLAKALGQALISAGTSPLASQMILVPHGSLKQWLLLQLSLLSVEKGVAGYKILTLEEAFSSLLSEKVFLPQATELFFSIYEELSKTQDEALRLYLNQNSKRWIELSDHLTTLFLRYGQYGGDIFSPQEKMENWQKTIFHNLFIAGKFKLPIQVLSQNKTLTRETVHCFGFDFLAAPFWDFFCRFSDLSIYLFSPCSHYWDDLCTPFERKGWNRYWKKKGVPPGLRDEWTDYWLEAPPLLANWGRLGRETIKILDRFDLEMKEDYSPDMAQKNSLLKKIQTDLLEFSRTESSEPSDSSIQIFLSGSSRLREIENLRETLLRLIQEEGLLPSDCSVFAPEIENYVPFIEFVFKDLPFKIFGISIGSKSFFLQGLHRLFTLSENNWDSEDIQILFETPSFFKRQKWDSEQVDLFCEWLSEVSVTQKGLEQLVSRWIHLSSQEKKGIELSEADSLEAFLYTLTSLQADLSQMQSKTMNLGLWADLLEYLAAKYLVCNELDEADQAAWSFFQSLLRDLRRIEKEKPGLEWPFAPLQQLMRRTLRGQMHSSQLNAIRFSSLNSGFITPNKAIFLIGMDEASFPRVKIPSSLDLLKNEKTYIPDSSDEDRYLFLQTLFAARDFLLISYRHLSADEGKPMESSFLVQELLRSIPFSIKSQTVHFQSQSASSTPLSIEWPEVYEKQLPEGDFILSLSDLALLSRHPWKFYLRKKWGIYFEEEETESFLLSKAKLLRSSLKMSSEDLLKEAEKELPPGLCGEALREECIQKVREREAFMALCALKEKPLFSLALRDSCLEKRWIDEERLELPALQLDLTDRLRIRLVGEIQTVSIQGAIHLGEDSLNGILKNWPEYLVASLALSTHQIFLLKSEKIKKIEAAQENLKAFLIYYFYALSAPSPLLPLWADSLLLKGNEELEKKIGNIHSGKGIRFEDPVFEWVASRADVPSAHAMIEKWGPVLKQSFSGLMDLYPGRGKHA